MKILIIAVVLIFAGAVLFSGFSSCANGVSSCADSNTRRVCVGGQWTEQNCPLGCRAGECGTCESGDARCAGNVSFEICNSGFWSSSRACPDGMVCYGGGCYLSGQAPDECKYAQVNETRCYTDSQNVSALQACSADKKWVNESSCTMGCAGTQACKECDYEKQDAQCLSNISFRKCLRNETWSEQTFCQSNYKCDGGKCVSTSFACEIGDLKCVGNSVYKCYANEGWKLMQNCYEAICRQNESSAQCEQENSCFGWGEYSLLNSTAVNETDAQGRARECKNSTYVRNCLGFDGDEKLGVNETVQEYNCSNWTELCPMQLKKTQSYERQNGSMCSDCTDKTYVPRCEGGEEIAENTTVKRECGQWHECAPAANVQAGQENGGIIGEILAWIASLFS
ncbi:MAG: hypothetical protein V1822_04180 [Candidatus Micrarchaeota archaeon]